MTSQPVEAAAEVIPGAIGLSGSTVSRAFIEASAAKLRELQERDLSREDVVALVLDGKTFAESTMVVALGITMTGEKRFLGFVETDTENEKVLTPFLRSLVERGLDVSQGLLLILDGGKGLRAAVRKAFRHRALVQRCQWHTRENVVSYLAKSEQPAWRQRLQRAYNRPEYDEALAALQSLQHELEDRNLARQALGMAVAIAWLPGPAGTRRRVAKLSVEEPDAAEPARPDLWGARVSNDPGLPDLYSASCPHPTSASAPSSRRRCACRTCTSRLCCTPSFAMAAQQRFARLPRRSFPMTRVRSSTTSRS